MTQILVLGASRSGTAALQRAVSDATGIAPILMGAQLGMLHRAAQAIKSHADAVMTAEPAAVSEIGLQTVLIRFWKSLLDESRQAERDGLLIGAPEMLPDCPNLKGARTLMALFPAWRAIAVHRHPIDFIGSRLRACPESDFTAHCVLWANAAQQVRKLKHTLGSRVLVLSHSDLLGAPEEAGASIASFLRLDEDAGRVVGRSLRETRPGRSATFVYDTVLKLGDTSWSTPETSLFKFLCEEQATALGYILDMGGVEQSRPVDLVHILSERCNLSGKWLTGVSDNREYQPRIRCGDSFGAAGALRIGPISAGSRRRLRLLFMPEIMGGNSELRLDVVQSVSRRPIFGHTFVIQETCELKVDTMLPSHDGLLDVIFSGGDAGALFELVFREASISHA